MEISTALRNAMVDAAVDLIDGGVGAGVIKFFSGAEPASLADADPAGLLATLTFSDPAFGAASGGSAAAATIAPVAASAGGTVASFRGYDSAGTKILQGDVAEAGADINFDETTWNLGDTIEITSLTFAQPAE